jgi:carbon storage regulator
MLVLTRKLGEKVVINGNVTLTIVEMKGNRVTIAFDAPGHVRILRGELLSLANQMDRKEKQPVEWEERAPCAAAT